MEALPANLSFLGDAGETFRAGMLTGVTVIVGLGRLVLELLPEEVEDV